MVLRTNVNDIERPVMAFLAQVEEPCIVAPVDLPETTAMKYHFYKKKHVIKNKFNEYILYFHESIEESYYMNRLLQGYNANTARI